MVHLLFPREVYLALLNLYDLMMLLLESIGEVSLLVGVRWGSLVCGTLETC